MAFKIVVGGNNATINGGGEYSKGDIVRLQAIPFNEYSLSSWKLIKSQTDNDYVNEDYIIDGNNVLVNKAEESVILGNDSVLIIDTSTSTLFEDGNEYLIIADIIYHPTYRIKVSSQYGTPYQSATIVDKGESVTIRARNYYGVIFTHWSDGSVEVERTIVPTSDVDLVANYAVIDSSLNNYQYRAFVKDALNVNALPKAFLVVTS